MAVVDSKFKERLSSYLDILNPVLSDELLITLKYGEWGIKDKFEGKITLLEDLQLLFFYLIAVEWKVYEKNTFELKIDNNSCPLPFYPSTVADKDIIECICKYFDCKHSINVEPLLKSMTVLPLGVIPDGLSFMIVDKGTICDNNILEVNKQ